MDLNDALKQFSNLLTEVSKDLPLEDKKDIAKFKNAMKKQDISKVEEIKNKLVQKYGNHSK